MFCRNLIKCRPMITLHNYSTLSEINGKMQHILNVASANNLGSRNTLKEILKLTQELRSSGENMNSETFEHVLSAYAKTGDHKKTLLLHKQMLARGVQPEKSFYQKALRLLGKGGDATSQAKLLHQMQHFGYPITSRTYSALFLCMRENLELERALDTLDIMKKKRIIPSLTSYFDIINIAIRLEEPEVAFELLTQAEKLSAFDTNSNGQLYMQLLRVAAYKYNHKIVQYTWDKVVNACKMKPDEGLLLSILDVAGKNGDPKLATEVIQVVGESGYPYQEAHFMPLIEAFVSTGDIKNTFQVFSAMRNVGVIPNKRTALPVVYKLGKDKAAIRQAQEALESANDVSAFNLVIHALAYNKEYDEALDLFRDADRLGITPDSETLDAVLDACIHCQDAYRGISIYDKLSPHVEKTTTTLSKMVTLMCTQEEDYEDAFVYLEEMKQLGMIPLRGCYFKLVKTLSKAGDPRLSMALDDMKAYGYSLSTHMTDFMEREELRRAEEEERSKSPISIM